MRVGQLVYPTKGTDLTKSGHTGVIIEALEEPSGFSCLVLWETGDFGRYSLREAEASGIEFGTSLHPWIANYRYQGERRLRQDFSAGVFSDVFGGFGLREAIRRIGERGATDADQA
jgi:hypothetical protein